MYIIYAIASKSRNYIYVGLTSNLEARMLRHNKGYEKTTRPYPPFKLVYIEVAENRSKARLRKKYWKSGTGKEKLKQIRKECAGLSTDR